MNFKRYIEASDTWVDSHYIMGTSTDTITTLPAVLYPNDTTATVGLKGQTLQSSIPSPTSPVMPQGTGEKTGNLAKYWKAAYVTASGTVNANKVNGVSFPVKIEAGQTVCFTNQKTNFGRGIAVFSGFDGETPTDIVYRSTNNTVTYTADSDCYVIIWGNYDNTTSMDESVFALCGQMLNLGSTALPYEPYGYKIPISSGGENLYGGTDISGTINNTYYKNDFIYSNIAQGTYTLAFDLTTETPSSQTYASSIGVGETTYSKDIQIQSGKSDGHFVFTFTIEAEDAGKNLYARFARYGAPVTIAYTASNIMLNLGSTAKPYVPYNRTTTPIYLGEVETTRKIKKLVLTGEEFVYVYANADIAFRINTSDAMLNYRYCVCTHFSYQRTPGHSTIDGVTAGAGDYNLYFTFSSSSATQFGVVAGDTNSFKSFLQQQYAAGTPVTAWYVLAEPTTGIVNEPLMKIGDYADTLSNISIPVTAGGDTLSVDTTVQPSEVTVNYKGWHPVQSVHERENSAWT